VKDIFETPVIAEIPYPGIHYEHKYKNSSKCTYIYDAYLFHNYLPAEKAPQPAELFITLLSICLAPEDHFLSRLSAAHANVGDLLLIDRHTP
jgi:hypothetical protein